VAEQLLASQEEFGSMELLRCHFEVINQTYYNYWAISAFLTEVNIKGMVPWVITDVSGSACLLLVLAWLILGPCIWRSNPSNKPARCR
jgi:hypothetical protein